LPPCGGSPHALSTGVFTRFPIKPHNHTQPTTPGSFYLSALVALAPSLLWWGVRCVVQRWSHCSLAGVVAGLSYGRVEQLCL
jgi:hypothetical protein